MLIVIIGVFVCVFYNGQFECLCLTLSACIDLMMCVFQERVNYCE